MPCRSFPILLLMGGFLFAQGPLKAQAVTCLGDAQNKHALIYLHGLEPPEKLSSIEKENRLVLARLAQHLPFRIILPQSQELCEGKRCWPGRDAAEVDKVYAQIIKISQKNCGPLGSSYGLLGFSNGGYFAFKLYKWQRDPRLKWILATGSAGSWDSKIDRPSPYATFRLMIGLKEITRQAALSLERQLKPSLPAFRLDSFPGGHQLHYETTLGILRQIKLDGK